MKKIIIALFAVGLGLEVYAWADVGPLADTHAPIAAGSAVAQPPPPVVVTAPPPDSRALPPPVSAVSADQLHDPVAAPMAAFDDVRAAQKVGWPLALLAALIMLARGLHSAALRWPDVGWLGWLGTGTNAFVLAGVITVGSAAFNTLALGGTWFAVAMAAFGSMLALLAPTPKAAA